MAKVVLPDEPGYAVQPRSERPRCVESAAPTVKRYQRFLDEIAHTARVSAEAVKIGKQRAFPASEEHLQGTVFALLDPRHQFPVVSHVRMVTAHTEAQRQRPASLCIRNNQGENEAKSLWPSAAPSAAFRGHVA